MQIVSQHDLGLGKSLLHIMLHYHKYVLMPLVPKDTDNVQQMQDFWVVCVHSN